MKTFGMIIGGIITLIGLSIMVTPLRTYFLIGWITGVVLFFNGLSMVCMGLRKNRSLSKCLVGTVTCIVGFILLASDFQQTITQVIIVNLVAGGIILSGIIECIVGYCLVKANRQGIPTLVTGGVSFAVGLAGIVFKDATVIVIGLIVGFQMVRIGASIFMYARDIGKPKVVNLNN